MPVTTTEIRNFVLLGHAHAGKTSLADACLHVTGANSRLGRVDDGSSLVDFDPDEKERKQSLDSHVLHCRHKGCELNIIDAPGMPDFIHGVIGATAAVEVAALVVSAVNGVEANTRKHFALAKSAGLARFIVVNKCDADNIDVPGLMASIQEAFGRECVAANLPADTGRDFKTVIDVVAGERLPAAMPVGEAQTRFIETVIEADEALMERYLGGEKLGPAELTAAMRKAVHDGTAVPVVFVSARTEVGVREMLDVITKYAPSPAEVEIHQARKSDGVSVPVKADPAAAFVGQVFKVAYPQRGKLAFVKVLAGKLKGDTPFTVNDDRHPHKAGHIFRVQGGETAEVPEAVAGDIVAIGRMEGLHLHDLLHQNGDLNAAVPPHYPAPMFSLAVEAKTRGDMDKVSTGLHELAEEDKTFAVTLDHQTGERVINGLGELHLRTALHRLRRKRGLEVNTKPPKIPYRETITQAVRNVEYTHKKQSGGAGQYGKVVIDIEPTERGAGYVFEDAIFGGAVSQSFRPSVDKGVQGKLAEGVLAGYPIVDVKVRLVDGKEHAVDSKDIAFQVAGREAFKKAFMAAKPVLLEPIVHVDVTLPADQQGTVNGLLAARRGRILGSDMLSTTMALVKAQMPLSEVAAFGNQLQSTTAGQGSYSVELSHYDPVPAHVQQQLVSAFKPRDEIE